MERGNGGRRLLVWDAPNMDMCLSEVIGERASSATRPNLGAVLTWLCARAEPDDSVEGCVFCNIPAGLEAQMSAWIVGLRHAGFSVFVKPKRDRRDDVDADMVRHIERRGGQGTLREVVVASHDGKAFSGPLRRLARSGVEVVVLGYREKDTFATHSDELAFVDLEDVPAAFERPLPRTNLFDLPGSGRWFAPFEPPPRPAPAGGEAGAAAAAGIAVRAVDQEPPGSSDVLAEVEAEVHRVVAAGGRGLTLRDVGQLLRTRYPGHALFELGFTSVADLVDALVAPGALLLVRRPGEGHILVLPDPPADTPGTTPPSAAPPKVTAPEAAAPPAVVQRPSVGDTAPPDLTMAMPPNGAEGSERSDDLAGFESPEASGNDDARILEGPAPADVHPIYRAFGLGAERQP